MMEGSWLRATTSLSSLDRRKACSGHKEEGRGKRRQQEHQIKDKFCKSLLSRGCIWRKTNQAHLHETTVQPLSSASPKHSGATCQSPPIRAQFCGLHLRQQILLGEEGRPKIQEELFLKPQVPDFWGALCQEDVLGDGELPWHCKHCPHCALSQGCHEEAPGTCCHGTAL